MTAFLIMPAVAAEAYLLGSVDTGILVSKYFIMTTSAPTARALLE